MKYILFVLLVWLILKTSLNTYNVDQSFDNLEHKIDSLTTHITTISAAQAQHFSQCSFIHRDEIEVGFDNYLRKKK